MADLLHFSNIELYKCICLFGNLGIWHIFSNFAARLHNDTSMNKL